MPLPAPHVVGACDQVDIEPILLVAAVKQQFRFICLGPTYLVVMVAALKTMLTSSSYGLLVSKACIVLNW